MPKPRTYYVCTECGAESPQYFGKCPSCDTWNTLQEQTTIPADVLPSRGLQSSRRLNGKPSAKAPQPRASLTFPQIIDGQEERWFSGYGELDRVLGGGVVPGSLVL